MSLDANIINLADRRKRVEPPSIQEISKRCSEEIFEDWERFARNNRLNDYFVSSAPSWTTSGIDYLSDLNALSLIEIKLDMTTILMSPGATSKKQLGWQANFVLHDTNMCGPFMMFEAYARCFNILLFLKVKRALTQYGIT